MIDLDVVAQARQEMVEITRQIYARGLSSASSGNTSARLPGVPDHILIKASGKSFGEVEPEDFLLVDLEGKVLAGKGTPSKEIKFHLGIYKTRPDVQAIVHGHSAYATAYVTAKGELPVVTAAGEAGLSYIGVVDYAPPGSLELAEKVIHCFKDPQLKAAVLKRHGFITVGESLRRAFFLAEVLEDNAKVAFLMAQLT